MEQLRAVPAERAGRNCAGRCPPDALEEVRGKIFIPQKKKKKRRVLFGISMHGASGCLYPSQSIKGLSGPKNGASYMNCLYTSCGFAFAVPVCAMCDVSADFAGGRPADHENRTLERR